MADKLTMTRRRCTNCGVECWHNPSPKKDSKGHCTYCGYPPQGNGDSIKRASQEAVMKKQVARASLLGITSI